MLPLLDKSFLESWQLSCFGIIVDLRSELCRLLNCILCRVNMSNPRLPVHIKSQSTTLLARTKCILVQYLMANYGRALPNDQVSNRVLVCVIYLLVLRCCCLFQLLTRYLEAFYSCGQLYLVIYRYSVRASRESDVITVAHSPESIANLNDFFVNLNDASKFNLGQKVAKQAAKSTDYRLLFQLVSFTRYWPLMLRHFVERFLFLF